MQSNHKYLNVEIPHFFFLSRRRILFCSTYSMYWGRGGKRWLSHLP